MTEENIKFDREKLESLGYKINERKFSDIKRFFSEDYRRASLPYQDNDVVYLGAEHTGNPKLPNITILPNLASGGKVILGTTMGHQHTQHEKKDTRKFQEIYEFKGYGGMLLRNKQETKFHILKPDEKIIVGTADNMTLFNLDESPLLTLDYANPAMNQATKKLEEELGTFIFISFQHWGETSEAKFCLNKSYMERGFVNPENHNSLELKISMRDLNLGRNLYERLGKKGPDEQISRSLPGLSRAFYNESEENMTERFSKSGIKLEFGSNLPEDLREEFSPGLPELVLTKNKILFKELGMKIG